MSRGNGHAAHPRQRVRQRSIFMPVLMATGCFAVVVGAMFALYNPQERAAARSPLVTDNSTAMAAEQAGLVPEIAASQPGPGTVDRTSVPVVAPSGSTEPATRALTDSQPQRPQPSPMNAAAVRRQRVEAHLAVGEFGLAMETAQSATDSQERTQLLKKVLDAQWADGDFDAALASIRNIPDSGARVRARSEHTSQKALAGGNQFADFESLMNLIRQQTSGEWEEDGTGDGTMTPYENGVRVDPNGLLHRLTRAELTGWLEALGAEARVAELNQDVARDSSLRIVSLTSLEQELSKRLADGLDVTETMAHLAGLSQIRFLFVDPEGREILIGGPAEGWRYEANGTAVGLNSHKPTLMLDDLVTLLRTFGPGGSGIFGCSINPRPENLQQLKQFVNESNGHGPISLSGVGTWTNRLQSKLGLQDIEIYGVPPQSRVAHVIVEADYRMKLIGIDRLDGGPHIPSFFDLLSANQQNPPDLDALRWWLTMKYDAVLHSPDRNAFELQGSSVLCRSENQFVTDQGEHVHTGKAEVTNRLFAENFTRHYDELAQKDPVFAELQNIFDLALVAALIDHEGLADRIEWTMGAFAASGRYRCAAYPVPATVESVANHRVYNGRDIVAQVAGGVRADLMAVVTSDTLNQESPRLKNLANEAIQEKPPARQWWWDAAR